MEGTSAAGALVLIVGAVLAMAAVPVVFLALLLSPMRRSMAAKAAFGTGTLTLVAMWAVAFVVR
jgi:hypothetical protein